MSASSQVVLVHRDIVFPDPVRRPANLSDPQTFLYCCQVLFRWKLEGLKVTDEILEEGQELGFLALVAWNRVEHSHRERVKILVEAVGPRLLQDPKVQAACRGLGCQWSSVVRRSEVPGECPRCLRAAVYEVRVVGPKTVQEEEAVQARDDEAWQERMLQRRQTMGELRRTDRRAYRRERRRRRR